MSEYDTELSMLLQLSNDLRDAEKNIKIIEEERRKIYNVRDSIRKEIDNLQDEVARDMKSKGLAEEKYGGFRYIPVCPRYSVKVEDEEVIPSAFFREKIVREVDKKSIMDRLKSGCGLPGVSLKEGSYRLTLKPIM